VAERSCHEARHAAPRCQCRHAALTAENELFERAERVFNVPKPARVTLASLAEASARRAARVHTRPRVMWRQATWRSRRTSGLNHWCVEEAQKFSRSLIFGAVAVGCCVPKIFTANARESLRWPDASASQEQRARCSHGAEARLAPTPCSCSACLRGPASSITALATGRVEAALPRERTVHPTPQCLSCAAKARVLKPTRRDACIVAPPVAAQESVGRRAALRACFTRGASAPGRSRAAAASGACWVACCTLGASLKTHKCMVTTGAHC
jgi:hypothetical protein